MLGYVGRRLFLVPPVLWLLATALFFGLHVERGTPVAQIGVDTAEERRRSIRGGLTFDRDLASEYLHWLGNALRGNLGESPFFDRPVLDVLVDRAEPSLILVGCTFLVAAVVGLSAGLIAAQKRGKLFDRLTITIATVASATPAFWLAVLLLYVFSARLGWVPPAGYEPPSTRLVDSAHKLALPCASLGLATAGPLVLFTRSLMLGALAQDFARTARNNELAERVVFTRHALRSILSPLAGTLGLLIADLVCGAVVIEQLFSIPGVGWLMIQAISRRDFPVIQGLVLAIGCTFLIACFVIDIVSTALDPRLRAA